MRVRKKEKREKERGKERERGRKKDLLQISSFFTLHFFFSICGVVCVCFLPSLRWVGVVDRTAPTQLCECWIFSLSSLSESVSNFSNSLPFFHTFLNIFLLTLIFPSFSFSLTTFSLPVCEFSVFWVLMQYCSHDIFLCHYHILCCDAPLLLPTHLSTRPLSTV